MSLMSFDKTVATGIVGLADDEPNAPEFDKALEGLS